MEEPLANRETEGDGGHETTHLTSSETETGSDLEIISKEIQDLKTETKDALRTIGETLRSDVKKDLDDFKQDINQQFAKVAAEQQLQSGKINEAESQIEKLELWAQEANNALIISLREQKALQDNLTDLESRSRRNNLHIYGVTEGEEGESAAKFVQDLLRRELHLPEDFNLKIQRAHRSLAQKPANGAQLRPIIVNFLEFTTKERGERHPVSDAIHQDEISLGDGNSNLRQRGGGEGGIGEARTRREDIDNRGGGRAAVTALHSDGVAAQGGIPEELHISCYVRCTVKWSPNVITKLGPSLYKRVSPRSTNGIRLLEDDIAIIFPLRTAFSVSHNMGEKVIQDFRKFRLGSRIGRRDLDNAQQASSHCLRYCRYMVDGVPGELADLRFLVDMNKLRRYPTYLKEKGYKPTTIRNMMVKHHPALQTH
ncbi:hypothetical protein L3Q82_000421 [Scortum barcoo]|uniref:Uncharacterized protein n=1 Tax=Scortum barcoo TaxID=214431 RepID=A0ACB8XA68_9TELE|nr:hypothetical protein L3Q82_000421 [Scortum barcoo]